MCIRDRVENLENAFIKFANRIPFYGVCTFNAHDPVLRRLKSKIKRPWKTFGIKTEGEEKADYEASNITDSNTGSKFDLHFKGEKVAQMTISLPGKHNVLNALGAISLAHGIGLKFDEIEKSLECFKGVDRRFQTLYTNENCKIVDDYGHHPTEVAKTIETAIKIKGDRKVYVIFEPHRYSRTSLCWKEFVECFRGVDHVNLLPIYVASEERMEGISSENLAKDISSLDYCSVGNLNGQKEMDVFIRDKLSEKSLILCLGAGSIGRDIREIVAKL